MSMVLLVLYSVVTDCPVCAVDDSSKLPVVVSCIRVVVCVVLLVETTLLPLEANK